MSNVIPISARYVQETDIIFDAAKLKVATVHCSAGIYLTFAHDDQLNMLQYATYTVITPEGCATILWKSSEYASAAAEAMGVTSKRLEELGIVDHTIPEPLGGAHRDVAKTAANLKAALRDQLDRLLAMDIDDLVERRYKRLMSYGISSS